MFRNNLELIVGPVCSGKSAELIRRVDKYQIVGYDILLVKPKIDTRSDYVESRNGKKLRCLQIEYAQDIVTEIINTHLNKDINTDIVAIDEAQFFPNLYVTVKEILNRGFKVLVSALDTDFNGEPFGEVPKLLTLADTVDKLKAVCMKCKSEYAIFNQKLRKGGEQIEIGDLELYEPRCLNCFTAGGI